MIRVVRRDQVLSVVKTTHNRGVRLRLSTTIFICHLALVAVLGLCDQPLFWYLPTLKTTLDDMGGSAAATAAPPPCVLLRLVYLRSLAFMSVTSLHLFPLSSVPQSPACAHEMYIPCFPCPTISPWTRFTGVSLCIVFPCRKYQFRAWLSIEYGIINR